MLVTVEEPKVLTHTLVCCRSRSEVEKGKQKDEIEGSNVRIFFSGEKGIHFDSIIIKNTVQLQLDKTLRPEDLKQFLKKDNGE